MLSKQGMEYRYIQMSGNQTTYEGFCDPECETFQQPISHYASCHRSGKIGMLGICREHARFLCISYELGSVQLLSSHAAHVLAGLLPARTVASGSVAIQPCSHTSERDQQQLDHAFSELTYFDEPLELQLNHTSAQPVRQPAAAADSASSHPSSASSKPHSLEDLVECGESVQQLVDQSLGQIRAGHRVKRNLKNILYRTAAAAGKHGESPAKHAASAISQSQNCSSINSNEGQDARSNDPCTKTAAAAATQPFSSIHKQQHLKQRMLQDLDSNAFHEVTQQLKQDQQRQDANFRAFAVLRDLWQQAEPPITIKGRELDLINSYDATLRYLVHFKSLMQQQQAAAAAIDAPVQQQTPLDKSEEQPRSKSRSRWKSSAANSSSSMTSSASSSLSASSLLAAVSRTSLLSASSSSSAAAAAAAPPGSPSQQTIMRWRRTREAVLNELRIRDMAAMIETAGWELPNGKLDKATRRKKSLTKSDYIKIILQQELSAVEALLARRDDDSGKE